jgi:hypothetical protein
VKKDLPATLPTVTEWYSDRYEPVRPGFYQVSDEIGTVYFAYWNGEEWEATDEMLDRAGEIYFWRGVTANCEPDALK